MNDSESEVSVDSGRLDKLSPTQALAIVVPALTMLGSAYLLGYFSVVDLLLFSYLDLQDFVSATALFLPLWGLFISFAWISAKVARYKEGDRAYLRSKNEEEREKFISQRDKHKPDALDLLFDENAGEWRDDRVFTLKFFTVIAFLLLAAVFVSLFAGVKVSAIIVWPVVLLFGGLGQTLLLYFVERYDHPIDARAVLAASYSLYAFAWGVSAAQIDESRSVSAYTVSLNDGSELSATKIRRVGSNSLIRNHDSKSWMLVPQGEISSVERRKLTRANK